MPAAPKRKRGRPRLPDGERGVSVHLWLKTRDYDAVAGLAREQGISVNALLKRLLANGSRRPGAFRD